MSERKIFIKTFEDCVLVRGYYSCVLYDLTKKKYYSLSKKQAEWYEAIDSLPFSEIEVKAKKEKAFKSFFDFLLKKEIIFTCNYDDLKLFPKIKIDWYSPYKISNLIIVRSKESNNKILSLVDKFTRLGIKHIQLFLEDEINENELLLYLSEFSSTPIKSIEIITRVDISEKLLRLYKLVERTQLVTVTITNSLEFKLIKKRNEHPFNLLFIKNEFEEIFLELPPDPQYFVIDVRQFAESHYYNTYFNQKLIIDREDYLLTNIGGSKIGNIFDIDLEEFVNTERGQYLWKVKKDDIEICKDCEYRYMCVDSRTPLREKGKWRYTSDCLYDPYLGKWRN